MSEITDMSPRNSLSKSLLVVAACTVAAVAFVVTVALCHGDGEATIVHRDDPVADLLGWIPATDDTRSSFAIWTPDGGANASGAVVPVSEMHGEKLALEPMPKLLSFPTGVPAAFGFSTAQITEWAAAGSNSEIEVFGGDFDEERITSLLGEGLGYDQSNYRGAHLFVSPELAVTNGTFLRTVTPNGVIVLFGGRIITADSVE